MGRLVQAGQRVRTTGGDNRGGLEAVNQMEVTVGGDTYQDRLAKYIPGEIIAGYMALDRNLVPDAHKFAESLTGGNSVAHLTSIDGMTPWAPLLVGLIFTPLYIWQLARNEGPHQSWRMQATVSTLAFIVWAYAIQGSVFVIGNGAGQTWYNGKGAAFLLVVFTLVAAVFGPTPPAQDRPGGSGQRTHT